MNRRQLANDALAMFEAALSPTALPPISWYGIYPPGHDFIPTDGYDMVIKFNYYDDCLYGSSASASAGPHGPVIELSNGGIVVPGGVVGFCGMNHVSNEGWIPNEDTYRTILHELGHVFGIGTYWHLYDHGRFPDLNNVYKMDDSPVDTHWAGSRAVAAFNELGGSDYPLKRVPVLNRFRGANDHWRGVTAV